MAMTTLRHSGSHSKRLVAFERKGHRALRIIDLDNFLVFPSELRLIRKASKLSNVVTHITTEDEELARAKRAEADFLEYLSKRAESAV